MSRLALWVDRTLDVATYAVAVTAVVVALAGVPSFALGLGWLGVKWALFFVGWGAFGYATFALRPTPPWKRGENGTPTRRRLPAIGDRGETRFQSLVRRLPPARFRPLPVEDRLPVGVNLFVAAVAMLATSFLMEVVFGVGV